MSYLVLIRVQAMMAMLVPSGAFSQSRAVAMTS